MEPEFANVVEFTVKNLGGSLVRESRSIRLFTCTEEPVGTEARMLTVDDYGKIRIAHRDGMSIRAIARTFGHSRRKVREVLANAQPTPYTRVKPTSAPDFSDR